MTFENLRSIPFNTDQVAIAVSHSALGAGHLGICFHSAQKTPQLMHLAWHQKLLVDAVPDGLQDMCWIASALQVPKVLSKQLVAYVRAVASRSPKINYGIHFLAAQKSFAANGSYKPPKGSDGLTCSSFVVEVLRGAGIHLVRSETWQADPSNIAWGEAVCTYLARTADADHVASVRKNISGLRLRPYEVAGTAQLDYKLWPVHFDQAQQPARDVESRLHQVCSPGQ
jgi:hypothetical protein